MEMGKEKRKFTKPFAAALDHLIRVRGENNDIVGEAAGYASKGKAIDQIRNERSDGRYKYRLAIADHFGYTHDGFIDFGKKLIGEQNSATLPSPTMQTQASNVKSMHEHHALIDQFQDKETALEINHMLLVIEREDPKQLEKIKKVLAAFMPETGRQKKRRSGNGET